MHALLVLADRKLTESIGSHELYRMSPLLSINSSILKHIFTHDLFANMHVQWIK